ncbi:molybdopterin/thiamine biosynthesis adenylyltransferase [Cytobacillus oceanisediminis]|uniref:Molybdopterin/thiamine biosynthesis adenylyltransferase n=1 Tax=Cytobacillus oceanisediminis TaxID=665099 RepID=A0A2V2ZQK9_9BACI|nr:ThiF family adenylyltransferase [Cytobacillus oceanisediminis]PWW26612.1 molybdopterin/thiamine biosynthesis adenylyltransferase [Cytobacillus oceanisediminis]
MNYQTWFERRPELLEEEIHSFIEQDLNFLLDEQVKKDMRGIVFKGTVDVNGEEVELELIYPSEFPSQRIVIKASERNLFRHQNPFEKNLCVIPHDQYGWDSSMTGAFMVKQAIRLLEDIETGVEAVEKNEVESPEPWSNYLRFENVPLFITEHLPDSLGETGTFTIARYFGHYYENKEQVTFQDYHYVLEGIKQLGEQFELPKTLPFQRWNKPFPLENGLWFHLKEPPNFNIYEPKAVVEELGHMYGESNKDVAQLKSQINKYKFAQLPKNKKGRDQLPPHFAFIFDEENYERNQYRKAFIWGVYDFNTKSIKYSKPHYLTKDEHFKRIPELTSLDSKRVLIAGLGSLGSAVALELGKSGVGSLMLMDKDMLDVGNLVRHTGTIDYVGMRKTKLLEEQILSHYPFAHVEKLDYFIGHDVEVMERIYQKVSEVDLVINLTAEESVIRIFNRLSLELDKPVIHGWISNGAWGGRVLRTIPMQTGCYLCESEQDDITVASSPIEEIYPRGCGFPTFAGASFDIYGIATQTVRMAVDTLLERKLDYDHIIVQNYPYPKVEVFPHKRDKDCPLCGVKAE